MPLSLQHRHAVLLADRMPSVLYLPPGRAAVLPRTPASRFRQTVVLRSHVVAVARNGSSVNRRIRPLPPADMKRGRGRISPRKIFQLLATMTAYRNVWRLEANHWQTITTRRRCTGTERVSLATYLEALRNIDAGRRGHGVALDCGEVIMRKLNLVTTAAAPSVRAEPRGGRAMHDGSQGDATSVVAGTIRASRCLGGARLRHPRQYQLEETESFEWDEEATR
jgi:hypothetical protein